MKENFASSAFHRSHAAVGPAAVHSSEKGIAGLRTQLPQQSRAAQLQSMANEQGPVAQLQARAKKMDSAGPAPATARNKKVMQRMVPGQAPFKPVPQAGRYRARSGEDKVYNSQTYPRSTFSFGTHTRDDVFSQPRFVSTRQGNRVVSVLDPHTNQQVNVEGIQLDHHISWHNISTMMDQHNAQVGGGRPIANYYTLWDAKMYYNDITNLNPVLGGINAAAGAAGVQFGGRMPEQLAQINGVIQQSWMHLQQAMAARYAHPGGEAPAELMDELMVVSDHLARLADQV